MSRAKLRELGIDLPMFPTTTVGSFPKPDYLMRARSDFVKGRISRADLNQHEKRATEFWMRTQEELGIDVPVDGEMYRADMVAYFAEYITGFERGELVRSYGNRYYHKPIITGEVQWKQPITVEWWQFAQNLTQRPVKGMLTGPYTVMDWSFNEHYPDRRAACLALARQIRKEVEALIEAGAKIIQVDEPATSVRPSELPLAIEAMHIVTDDLPAYFITHICYGAFDEIYPDMLRCPVDNFDLEMSNSELDMLDLFRRNPYTKDISFGVVDVHSHRIEPPSVIQDRLRDALKVLPKENLWVDPDCGLKTRTVDEAIGKLSAMVSVAKALRGL